MVWKELSKYIVRDWGEVTKMIIEEAERRWYKPEQIFMVRVELVRNPCEDDIYFDKMLPYLWHGLTSYFIILRPKVKKTAEWAPFPSTLGVVVPISRNLISEDNKTVFRFLEWSKWILNKIFPKRQKLLVDFMIRHNDNTECEHFYVHYLYLLLPEGVKIP